MNYDESDILKSNAIIEIVADYFGLSVSELLEKTKIRKIAQPRMIAIYFIRKRTKLSLKRIGSRCGGLKGCSIVTNYKLINNLIETDDNIRLYISELFDIINPIVSKPANIIMLKAPSLKEIKSLPPTTDEKAYSYMINKF